MPDLVHSPIHRHITLMPFLLESPRLLTREISMEDLDFVAEVRGAPEVMRLYSKCYLREESKEWCRGRRRCTRGWSTVSSDGITGASEEYRSGDSSGGSSHHVGRPKSVSFPSPVSDDEAASSHRRSACRCTH